VKAFGGAFLVADLVVKLQAFLKVPARLRLAPIRERGGAEHVHRGCGALRIAGSGLRTVRNPLSRHCRGTRRVVLSSATVEF
jgi:hypothetical protein